jgi:magnesium-transporting ATPase (P-type)
LALAWKKVPELDYHLFHDYEMEKDLEFVALMGMIDQPRDEVAQAISSCHRAGIRVIMITGDYGLTAKAIAVKIGMDIEAKVVTGQELIAISDIKLREALQHEVIFARVNPTDKLRIVEQLKKMGEIVAVTGDGVNDAPALKRADIGIAMGLVGTDVARESADMILLDDNFATIVRAIKEGRIIFHNLKKTIFYVFASNAGELMTVVFGAIFGWVPILAVQILAVDLGTDVLPSLALGIDPGEKGIMNESPHNPKEKLLTLAILKRLLLVGFIMGLGAIFNYFRVKNSGGSYFEATASAYTTLVLCQIVNAYSIRHERDSIWKIGLFSNRLLIQAEIISFLLLLMIIYFPPIQRYMGTGPFHLIDWLYLLIVPVIFLVVEEIRKHYLRVQARNQRTKDLMAVLKTSQ